MSTFGGFMPEFSHIRVDFFRQILGVAPPLACFLSHVHSDHLAGLESLKSPFIYCSAATKALLLRLERYHHRVNYEKGILESHKQHFKHLKNLLKPIPLHTPTNIELAPGNDIQVTLFDANHCIGAVMFLIEGNSQAILYTGDVRAEPWFVNSLARNPFIVEYTSGLKTLDCIYLDTSFTEDVAFPTKAEGLAELLQKVSKYPPRTEFHLAAWTFGYEEVWMALSRSLKSQIHVDNYKMRLYNSLRGDGERLHGSYLTPEAPVLAGHKVGNTDHPGILTLDHTVRLHSCEKGLRCDHLGDQTVWIKPIIARTSSGQEICEIGIGGGGGDLNQGPEVELGSDTIIIQLMELFVKQEDSSIVRAIRRMLLAGLHSNRKTLVLNNADPDFKQDDMPLEELANILVRFEAKESIAEDVRPIPVRDVHLPKVITFPYSRHSSHAELRDLVRVFKPMDVYPCTVDKENWHEGVSMKALFGVLCSTNTFRHDQEMQETLPDNHEDETQNSWNGSNKDGSRTSSEDEDYKNDISDDDYEKITQGQRTNLSTMSTTTGTAISKDMHINDYEEQGTSIGVNAVSNLLKDRPGQSQSSPAQPLNSSPAPEAHNLRRRADLEEENGSSRKRARLQGDPTSIMPHWSSNDSNTPESEKDLQPTMISVPRVSYYDTHDGVYRCEACGWEVWRPEGACSGCGAGESAYYEVTSSTEEEGNEDPKPNSRNYNRYPRIYLSSTAAEDGSAMDVKAEERTNATGNYFDGASVYDSASNLGEDEYEMNSFIDESPVITENDGDTTGSASDDLDYQARYEELTVAYNSLDRVHEGLVEDHEAPRRDLLGSDYDDSGDSDGLDFDIVNTEVQDPPASEVVLSHVQGDSQSSAVSTSRLRTRVDAFLAAPEDWHNISLMSTGDNHAEESQEL